MLAFYKALALGPMGVVSPLGSLGVAVPVGVGLVLGERPGLLQFAGILVAVAGVCLAGGPQFRGAPVQRQAIALTLLAAFGFGAVMALIAEASTTLTGLFLALFVQRVTNVAAGGLALCVSVRRGAPALPADGFPWRSLPALAFVGLADVAANGTYSIAAQHGPVTVAAVLASLYPVVTAVAARGFSGNGCGRCRPRARGWPWSGRSCWPRAEVRTPTPFPAPPGRPSPRPARPAGPPSPRPGRPAPGTAPA